MEYLSHWYAFVCVWNLKRLKLYYEYSALSTSHLRTVPSVWEWGPQPPESPS